MKLIKDHKNKHTEQLEFMEKVQLDIWGKLKIIFPPTFAPHLIVVTTPVPDVATSVVLKSLVVPLAIQEEHNKKKKTFGTSSKIKE